MISEYKSKKSFENLIYASTSPQNSLNADAINYEDDMTQSKTSSNVEQTTHKTNNLYTELVAHKNAVKLPNEYWCVQLCENSKDLIFQYQGTHPLTDQEKSIVVVNNKQVIFLFIFKHYFFIC